MKTTDPKALKALARISAGHAVIYLPGQPIPYPLAWAGEHKGQAVFLIDAATPHLIPADHDAVVTDNAVAFSKAGALQFYVTPVAEAPEVKPGAVMDAVEDIREELAAVGGAEALLANF